ncbi:hypothetical protein TNCV_1432401 [Trichonephila clavipes]|nr:hypothetical protein TNCV_1432401 [Trichonephila clavipes]
MLQSTNEPTESRPTERRIIHEEVQKMLDEGIVQPSESPWSSPIVLEAGLKLNSKKCLFAAQEVKILGHLVSSNGVRRSRQNKSRKKFFPLQRIYMTYEVFLAFVHTLEDLLKVSVISPNLCSRC